MFTVCPKCALTLVVTAADLRVAQGYVRCGRCSNVFNALSRLSEDRQAGAQPQASPQPSPQPSQEPAAQPQPAPEPQPSARTAAGTPTTSRAPLTPDSSSAFRSPAAADPSLGTLRTSGADPSAAFRNSTPSSPVTSRPRPTDTGATSRTRVAPETPSAITAR